MAASDRSARRVLLVDDEPDILASLRDLLQISIPGLEVRTAESGAAALAVLDSDRVDLIISDYKMPGMDGLSFLSKARELAPGVPRILITAFPDLELALRAINESAVENFFTKPVEPSEVLRVVAAMLGKDRTDAMRSQAFGRAMELLRRRNRGHA